MALPLLVGGAECGPSNPLQGLSKRFDQDRGIQHDFFGAGRGGPSAELFRTQQDVVMSDQDAESFFSGPSPTSRVIPKLVGNASVYDLSAMHASLLVPTVQESQHQSPLTSWAADFMQHQPAPEHSAQHQPLIRKMNGDLHADIVARRPENVAPAANTHWAPNMTNFRMSSLPAFVPQMQHLVIDNRGISWDKEFQAQELQVASQAPTANETRNAEQMQQKALTEGDDLSRTAGLLLDTLKHEQNPKFQNSQFMGLMKQLRDREVVVDGNQIIENDGNASAAVDLKGKGRAIESIPLSNPRSFNSASNLLSSTQQGEAIQQWEQESLSQDKTMDIEDANAAYFRRENEDFIRYWKESRFPAQQGIQVNTAETMIWDKLQEDWENFEATATGIKPTEDYQFHSINPYLLGDSSKTRHHLLHTGSRISMSQSVLELEAAVQRNLNDATAWYDLGVKQQENEREQKALQALQRAVGLDPTYLPAWLALAVSCANDNNRQGTYDSINEWVSRNTKYESAVQNFRALHPNNPRTTLNERYSYLTECLITMATSDRSGEIDADIQIALAVLLNTNEEYGKAQDCFKTALAVRPNDWLLYNRVAATLANSGQAEKALEYYYRALELNPGYIRARFNLGISYINLRRYEEAAQHILDALVLQESDGTGEDTGSNGRGVASTILWDTLKTASWHLERPDLAVLCENKDLEGFRNQFV